MRKSLTKFSWNFECEAVEKCVNLENLVKSFQTSIYLQTLASIQPRRGLSKFAQLKPNLKLEKTLKLEKHRFDETFLAEYADALRFNVSKNMDALRAMLEAWRFQASEALRAELEAWTYPLTYPEYEEYVERIRREEEAAARRRAEEVAKDTNE